jgi:hypothetical protein
MAGRLLGGVATSLLFSVFEAWLIGAHANANVMVRRVIKTTDGRGGVRYFSIPGRSNAMACPSVRNPHSPSSPSPSSSSLSSSSSTTYRCCIQSHLGKSFSYAQYGNSVVAILAGQVANRAAGYREFGPASEGSGFYVGGYLGPFDVSLLALIACGLLAAYLWEENYGGDSKGGGGGDDGDGESDDGKAESTATGALKGAFEATVRNPDVLSCGIISSLFEGSMYIFVFMWTPALTTLAKAEMGDTFDGLPFGVIFSTFMVCCMAGSSIFSIAMERMKPEQLAVIVFGVAAFAFLMVVYSGGATTTFLAMNLFEVCVGMYFPSMGTMKGMIVPENKRAAIYNLFRIPLNFIVLFSLLTDLTPRVSFILCGSMMIVATVLQMKLKARRIN